MAGQGGGAVVNVVSGSASLGVPGHAGYVASKHAVAGLTRTAAIEYAPRGVRVNAVAPGLVLTPAMDGLDVATFAAAHPIGRAVEAEEVRRSRGSPPRGERARLPRRRRILTLQGGATG